MEEKAAEKRRRDRLNRCKLRGAGRFHALHTCGVEHIGKASCQQAAQKGERRAGRVFSARRQRSR